MLIDTAVIIATASPAHRSHLTRIRPHAMLPALGKPLVIRVMDQIYRENIHNYIVVLGINEGSVASYLNTSWVPDANIEFVLKSANDGLDHILASIARKLGKPFIITSYNSFTHPQFIDRLLNQSEKSPGNLILSGATSTLSYSEGSYYAIMDDAYVQEIIPNTSEDSSLQLIDVAVCGIDFVDYIANVPSEKLSGAFLKQLPDVFQLYVEAEGNQTTICEAAWILPVNTDADLLTINRHQLDDGVDAHILSELPPSTKINPPVRIDPRVSVGQGAIIGPYVYLEEGCSVGYGAVIQNAIILENASIAANTTIENVIVSTQGILSNL